MAVSRLGALLLVGLGLALGCSASDEGTVSTATGRDGGTAPSSNGRDRDRDRAGAGGSRSGGSGSGSGGDGSDHSSPDGGATDAGSQPDLPGSPSLVDPADVYVGFVKNDTFGLVLSSLDDPLVGLHGLPDPYHVAGIEISTEGRVIYKADDGSWHEFQCDQPCTTRQGEGFDPTDNPTDEELLANDPELPTVGCEVPFNPVSPWRVNADLLPAPDGSYFYYCPEPRHWRFGEEGELIGSEFGASILHIGFDRHALAQVGGPGETRLRILDLRSAEVVCELAVAFSPDIGFKEARAIDNGFLVVVREEGTWAAALWQLNFDGTSERKGAYDEAGETIVYHRDLAALAADGTLYAVDSTDVVALSLTEPPRKVIDGSELYIHAAQLFTGP